MQHCLFGGVSGHPSGLHPHLEGEVMVDGRRGVVMKRLNVGGVLGSVSRGGLAGEQLNCSNWLVAPKGTGILSGTLPRAAVAVSSVVSTCASMNMHGDTWGLSLLKNVNEHLHPLQAFI